MTSIPQKQHNIYFMTKALESIERLPIEERDQDYTKLINEIKGYLYDHCSHHFIKDIIDITPDRSKEIFFCEMCYTECDVSLVEDSNKYPNRCS